MPVPSVAPTPAGPRPGLLRRAWRAVAAMAGVVRTGERRSGPRSARRPAATPAMRASAALRLLGSAALPWIGALPFSGLPMWRLPHRIPLGCHASRRRRWPLDFSLTPEAVCRFASMNPAVWDGGFRLPTAAVWRERYTPSRHRLHAEVARDDRERPLRALRCRWRLRAEQLPAGRRRPARAIPAAPARTMPASRRSRPPAQASPPAG